MIKTVKLGLILMIFCVISAGLLAYVYGLTQPRIEQNAKRVMENAQREVLPPSGKGVVRQITVKGYSSEISILVGMDETGKVSRVKILSQRETPGLGAKVMERKFLDQFNGKGTGEALEPKQDIDAITGATITRRAVCVGVRQVLRRTMGGDK
jgi:Na+-translocating ferredoxin:NAD+ oxidoreductase subunit G